MFAVDVELSFSAVAKKWGVCSVQFLFSDARKKTRWRGERLRQRQTAETERDRQTDRLIEKQTDRQTD